LKYDYDVLLQYNYKLLLMNSKADKVSNP